jgi:hypothetical protein
VLAFNDIFVEDLLRLALFLGSCWIDVGGVRTLNVAKFISEGQELVISSGAVVSRPIKLLKNRNSEFLIGYHLLQTEFLRAVRI